MSQMMRDYLLMSGYASFIWPAYGIAAFVLIGLAVESRWRLHKATTELRRIEASAIQQASPTGTGCKRDQLAGS